MLALAEHDILHRGLLQLRAFFGDLPVEVIEGEIAREDFRIDGLVAVEGHKYPYEIIGQQTQGQLKRKVEQLRQRLPEFILILEYADEKIRDFCRENQVNFVDGAGNAYLNLPRLEDRCSSPA